MNDSKKINNFENSKKQNKNEKNQRKIGNARKTLKNKNIDNREQKEHAKHEKRREVEFGRGSILFHVSRLVVMQNVEWLMRPLTTTRKEEERWRIFDGRRKW